MPSIFDEIRAKSEEVCRRAESVRIRREAIADYARALPLGNPMFTELDPDIHFLGHGPDTVAFLLILDSINFGSGYSHLGRKRRGQGFYFSIASSLADFARSRGVPSAKDLQRFSIDDLFQIFDQDPRSAPQRELMELFLQALQTLGALVEKEWGGSFTEMVLSAGRSAQRLVDILRRMPFFEDVHRYQDLAVPFFKRAQITAADLFLAFEGREYGEFSDIHCLTAFADNTVPHVLHLDGILSYTPALGDRIAKLEPLPSGSAEEVEIRAAAVHAVELMASALREQGAVVKSHQIDQLLWMRGQESFYKSQPSHKAVCVYY